MKNNEIEEKMQKIISDSVPDVLDNILLKAKGKENIIMAKEKSKEKKNNLFIYKLAGAMAVLLIAIVGVFGIYNINNVSKIESIVEFDVNPSIELKLSRDEKVVDFGALNDDGIKILDGMDLKGSDIKVATNAIVGSMLKQGYITVDQNSILVSVHNNDTKKAEELSERISKEVSDLLKANSIEESVISQSFSRDKIKETSKENSVSEGKAELINKALKAEVKDAKGNIISFEDLSKLSINEINVLLNAKQTKLENTNVRGTASRGAYIGEERAKEIAFLDSNVNTTNVTIKKVELDFDDGKMIYEVDFYSNGMEYEYEIDAKTGEILEKDIEGEESYNVNNNHSNNTNNQTSNQSSNNTNSSTTISSSRAKEIAFANAGVSGSSVRELKVELDHEYGKQIYEVEFKSGNMEYDYDIDALTGNIINSKKEYDD